MSSYRLRRFRPEAMKKNNLALLLGRRGSGKGVLLEDLLFHNKDQWDYAIAMTPILETVRMLERHMPTSCIFESRVDAVLEEMFRITTELNKCGRRRSILLIFDDLVWDKASLKGSVMRRIHMAGRHNDITFFNLMQYCMDMDRPLRTQLDYVFAYRENSEPVRHALYEQFFANFFPSFEDFTKVLNTCTRDFGCLVLDNNASSSRPEDAVFWYRAKPEQPPFQMLRPIFHEMAEHYKRDSESTSERMLRLRREAGLEKEPSPEPEAPAPQTVEEGLVQMMDEVGCTEVDRSGPAEVRQTCAPQSKEKVAAKKKKPKNKKSKAGAGVLVL